VVEIDLHGLKHKEVEDTLESMLVSYYNLGNFPIRVITGHSLIMKKILNTAVDNQRFNTREEVHNSGATIVYE
jgi:DNA-nicking Smr family endonuclease